MRKTAGGSAALTWHPVLSGCGQACGQVSDADLKLAYRRLCMIFHPDKHTDPAAKEAATRSFRAINEAYKGTRPRSLRSLEAPCLGQ